jgi:hypothetical protein
LPVALGKVVFCPMALWTIGTANCTGMSNFWMEWLCLGSVALWTGTCAGM